MQCDGAVQVAQADVAGWAGISGKRRKTGWLYVLKMKDDDGGEVKIVLNRQVLRRRTTRMEETAAGDGAYSGLQ